MKIIKNEFVIEDDMLMKYVGNKKDIIIPEGVKDIFLKLLMRLNLINKEDNRDTKTSYQIIFN